MEPWYKVVTPRKEVREGRSFAPSKFAIALEQVVDGTPSDSARPGPCRPRPSAMKFRCRTSEPNRIQNGDAEGTKGAP
jgi:hypothetical protein